MPSPTRREVLQAIAAATEGCLTEPELTTLFQIGSAPAYWELIALLEQLVANGSLEMNRGLITRFDYAITARGRRCLARG
jgi:hypothetical protein